MPGEKAVLGLENENEEAIDFDFAELEEALNEEEAKLGAELEAGLSELEFLDDEKNKINNSESLGVVIGDVICQQINNQIAAKAGEDFIKENHGLTLDLRKDAHIQTTENFAKGNIATHNTEIDYQQRYDDWQDSFQKDENGNVKKKIDKRSGKEKEVLKKNARKPYDENRPKGSVQQNVDEIVPVAEIIRDPAANAHLTKEERIAFDNSEKNLNPMDAAANQSKGDSTMDEWLNSERDGKKPAERFDIDEDKLRKLDEEARAEYEKLKAEGEKRSIEAGKKSRRAETKRVAGKALRTVIMALLTDFTKEVIANFVKWMKSANKNWKTLFEYLKNAVVSFAGKLKLHLLNVAQTVTTMIANSILGPIASTIKKVIDLLKQGWKSFKEAVNWLRDKKNKNQPFSVKVAQVGKIIMTGLSATGAIALSEVIEKGLTAIPGVGAFLSVDIPLLGSLANILGMLLGALVAGIIGAVVINLIDKFIAKNQKAVLTEKQVDKGNEIMKTQQKMIELQDKKVELAKEKAGRTIKERHKFAAEVMKNSLENIFSDIDATDDEITEIFELPETNS